MPSSFNSSTTHLGNSSVFSMGLIKKKKKTPANVPKDVACFPVALLPSLPIFYTFKMIPFLIPFHRKRRNF
jgi:hypothetical protein